MDINLWLLKMRVAPRSICLLYSREGEGSTGVQQPGLWPETARWIFWSRVQQEWRLGKLAETSQDRIFIEMCWKCFTGQDCCALLESVCKWSERYSRLELQFSITVTDSVTRWILRQTPLLRWHLRGRVDAWCWELSQKLSAKLSGKPFHCHLDRAAMGRSCAPGSSQRERNPLILLSGLRSPICSLAKMGWGKRGKTGALFLIDLHGGWVRSLELAKSIHWVFQRMYRGYWE